MAIQDKVANAQAKANAIVANKAKTQAKLQAKANMAQAKTQAKTQAQAQAQANAAKQASAPVKEARPARLDGIGASIAKAYMAKKPAAKSVTAPGMKCGGKVKKYARGGGIEVRGKTKGKLI